LIPIYLFMGLKSSSKKILKSLFFLSPVVDILFLPLTLAAAGWFRLARYWGIKNLPLTKKTFLKLGMFPIVDHYYDPLFDYRKIPTSNIHRKNVLPLDPERQLSFVRTLNYGQELIKIPAHSQSDSDFYYVNGSFGSGDAELYYSIIRKNKPKRIIEVGSGFSTRIALKAIADQKNQDPGFSCRVTCIEPYEMPFLEKLNVDLVRKKVEDIDVALFKELGESDILFIDSSHILRPGGDVLLLILQVLPTLKKGVWIHFHDIFTPADYPIGWLKDEFRMWNEQYLLEGFLLYNEAFEVVASINLLNKEYKNEIASSFPVLGNDPEREPGSFWIRKIQ
jgi:hypothetical protein